VSERPHADRKLTRSLCIGVRVGGLMLHNSEPREFSDGIVKKVCGSSS